MASSSCPSPGCGPRDGVTRVGVESGAFCFSSAVASGKGWMNVREPDVASFLPHKLL